MPVHLREDVVQESEHQGCLSSPVQLCRGHAVRAHSIDPPPVLDAGHLVFPVFLEHFYAPVGVGDIRLAKIPPSSPKRSVPALLSGPSAPGSGPVPEGVDRGEASRPPEVSIIRLPLSGPSAPGGGWCCGSPSQGPRHLGTAPAPAGEHPEVPHQCPRMGLGVDEDGPPLS